VMDAAALIYGTNLGGYRAAYALCKKGYKVILLNRGSWVNEVRNQALSQLPLDLCWLCGQFPQRLFKSLGCLQDYYNSEVIEVTGQGGDFRVKFKKRDQLVDNYSCIECDRCVEACPVEVAGRKPISVHPQVMWENTYLIDWENCPKCGKCEEACPTGALKLERKEEVVEVRVGAIILAWEFEEPTDEELRDFGVGRFPWVVRNSELARRSSLTNFVRDSLRLASGQLPHKLAIVITPHFQRGKEYEPYNLSVTAVYRALKVKGVIPEAQVAVYLRDYRGFGKSHYRWYVKAVNAGVKVVRAERLQVLPQTNEEATLKYELEGEERREGYDLVILIAGQRPPTQMGELSRLFGVKPDRGGFCRLREFSSTQTDVDGIFAVGEFTGPKGNPETIWEGCAALSEALKYLGEPTFKPPPSPQLRDLPSEEAKIGVFICSCFGTFESKLDLPQLAQRVAEIPGVSHAEIIRGCCTPATIKETAERIRASGVNRVVLAACTPIQKSGKFRSAVLGAGLSPLLAEFLPLREDVINVHRDKGKMLKKALTLIRGGVEKVRWARIAPVLRDSFTPAALVLGAGGAGLVAAYEIAQGGFPVTLVEREGKLGGKTAYLNPKQRSYLQKLISQVEGDERITIYTNSELKGVDGYGGNFYLLLTTPQGEKSGEAGAIVVATGAREYRPDGFLYGQDEGVITQTELQNGLEKWKGIGFIAMIQCVGSRDEEHSYCSRVCCQQALRNALLLRENGSQVTIFYRDLTSYGVEDYYRRAVEAQVKFVRFPAAGYPQVSREGKSLVVKLPTGQEERADLVVLSTGIIPDRENNERLAALLGYSLDQDGFWESDADAYPYEEIIKKQTKPYEWATNCIYPVGGAHSPRGFAESLLTARDAAGRALVLLGKGELPPPNGPYVAEVKESLCMGCGLCVDVCPYAARYIDEVRKIAVVRPSLCDSCGACVAACPNDASYLRDFIGNQSIAALDALLL